MATKIRILFLSANPEGTTKLKVIEEFKLIDAKIQASEYRDQFDLEQSHAVSLMELQTLLLRFKPSIVHFSGHGSETGALVFENYDGSPEEAPPNALSALFRIINDGVSAEGLQEHHIQCVLLSACYSLKQAKAIAKHVDCVIGITDAIKDKSATNFAASFYQALGYGRSVQSSFDLGLNQLGLVDDTDQNILKLVHKKDVYPSKIFLVSAGDSVNPTGATVVRDAENNERARNLLLHCTNLFTVSRLQKDYVRLTEIDPDKDYSSDAVYDIELYGRQVFEHLYTGHRELSDLIQERKDVCENYHPIFSLSLEKIDRLLVTLLEKLGARTRNDNKEFRKLTYSILFGLKKEPWEKFRFDRIVANSIAMILWQGNDYLINVGKSDEPAREIAKNICLALDDLTTELKPQLIPFYQADEKYNEVVGRFEQAFQEFFLGIETGTAPMGGACKQCLSLKYHDKEEISKFRAALSELQR